MARYKFPDVGRFAFDLAQLCMQARHLASTMPRALRSSLLGCLLIVAGARFGGAAQIDAVGSVQPEVDQPTRLASSRDLRYIGTCELACVCSPMLSLLLRARAAFSVVGSTALAESNLRPEVRSDCSDKCVTRNKQRAVATLRPPLCCDTTHACMCRHTARVSAFRHCCHRKRHAYLHLVL